MEQPQPGAAGPQSAQTSRQQQPTGQQATQAQAVQQGQGQAAQGQPSYDVRNGGHYGECSLVFYLCRVGNWVVHVSTFAME